MSFKKQMIAGLKWSSVGTIGLAVFQLLQISILTRLLPKEAFGLIALALLVVNFTNIFVEMGLTSAIFYKQNATTKEYSSLYWLNIMISVFLYIVLFLLSKLIAVFYNEFELVNVIRVLSLNIIFISIGKQHKALLQKKLEFNVVAKIDLFSYLVGLLLAVYLAWKGYGVYSLIYSTLITSLLSSVMLLFIRLSDDPIELHFSFKDTKPFMKVGGYSLGSDILDYFSREIDIIIIGKFIGTEFLGVYSLAKQISLKAYSIMMPIIFNVFNPMLSTLNRDKERMEEYFLKIVYGVTNITFPVYLCIILAATEILTMLYGSNYKEGAITLIALSVFQASFTIVKPSGSLQIATGRTDVGFLWTIFRNVMTIIVLFIAISFFDVHLIPVFLAALSIVLVFLLWSLQIKRMTSIKFKSYILQFIYPLIVMSFVLLIKIILIDRLIIVNNNLISAFFKIILGLTLYISLIYLLDRRRILKTLNFILLKK
jgi:O-antigen/teichoic acid export membrane protein